MINVWSHLLSSKWQKRLRMSSQEILGSQWHRTTEKQQIFPFNEWNCGIFCFINDTSVDWIMKNTPPVRQLMITFYYTQWKTTCKDWKPAWALNAAQWASCRLLFFCRVVNQTVSTGSSEAHSTGTSSGFSLCFALIASLTFHSLCSLCSFSRSCEWLPANTNTKTCSAVLVRTFCWF